MIVRIKEIPEMLSLDNNNWTYKNNKGEWVWKHNDDKSENDANWPGIVAPEWANKPVFYNGHWCWEGDGTKKIIINTYLTDPVNGEWYKKIIEFCNNSKELLHSAGAGGYYKTDADDVYEYIDHMSIPIEKALEFAKKYAKELI